MQILFCDPKDRTHNLINCRTQPCTDKNVKVVLEDIIQKIKNLMHTKNKFHRLFKSFVDNYNDYEKKKLLFGRQKWNKMTMMLACFVKIVPRYLLLSPKFYNLK